MFSQKKHLDYASNIMKVRLAFQILSDSVSKSLHFLREISDPNIQKEFAESSATADFCYNFNNMADILNYKNKFSEGEFDCPLSDATYSKLKQHAEYFELPI